MTDVDIKWIVDNVRRLAEAWKLLAIGTLALATLICCSIYLLVKPLYTARMVMPVSQRVIALAAAGVLGSGLSISQELVPYTGLRSVSVTNPDPDVALAELRKSLGQIIEAAKPPPSARLRILADIDTLQRAVAELRGLKTGTVQIAGHVTSDIENLELSISMLQLTLDGIRPDEIAAQPSSAVLTRNPLSARTVSFAFGAAFALMAVFVLFRNSVRKNEI